MAAEKDNTRDRRRGGAEAGRLSTDAAGSTDALAPSCKLELVPRRLGWTEAFLPSLLAVEDRVSAIYEGVLGSTSVLWRGRSTASERSLPAVEFAPRRTLGRLARRSGAEPGRWAAANLVDLGFKDLFAEGSSRGACNVAQLGNVCGPLACEAFVFAMKRGLLTSSDGFIVEGVEPPQISRSTVGLGPPVVSNTGLVAADTAPIAAPTGGVQTCIVVAVEARKTFSS